MKNHSNLVFSLEEYQRRLNFLRKEMATYEIDLVAITDQEILTYLTGYQTTGYDAFQALFIPLEGECFSLTRVLEESNFTQRTWVEDTNTYKDTDNPLDVAIELIRGKGFEPKKLGIEQDSFFLRHATLERFRVEFPQAQLVNVSRYLDPCRRVKSSEEIEIMKKAAVATEASVLAGIDAAVVGNTENDIAAACSEAMFKAGGHYPSVQPYIVSGERTNIGHGTWENRVIGQGECVFIELAGCYYRYHTAMMRTLIMGKAPVEMLEAEKIALEALHTSMQDMKPGVPIADIAKTNNNIIKKAEKFGANQTGRSGYGIGISFAPAWDEGHLISLNPTDPRILEENMTIHLIPFFFMPKINMIMGISETVRITPGGAESFFSKPQRSLIIKD